MRKMSIRNIKSLTHASEGQFLKAQMYSQYLFALSYRLLVHLDSSRISSAGAAPHVNKETLLCENEKRKRCLNRAWYRDRFELHGFEDDVVIWSSALHRVR